MAIKSLYDLGRARTWVDGKLVYEEDEDEYNARINSSNPFSPKSVASFTPQKTVTPKKSVTQQTERKSPTLQEAGETLSRGFNSARNILNSAASTLRNIEIKPKTVSVPKVNTADYTSLKSQYNSLIRQSNTLPLSDPRQRTILNQAGTVKKQMDAAREANDRAIEQRIMALDPWRGEMNPANLRGITAEDMLAAEEAATYYTPRIAAEQFANQALVGIPTMINAEARERLQNQAEYAPDVSAVSGILGSLLGYGALYGTAGRAIEGSSVFNRISNPTVRRLAAGQAADAAISSPIAAVTELADGGDLGDAAKAYLADQALGLGSNVAFEVVGNAINALRRTPEIPRVETPEVEVPRVETSTVEIPRVETPEAVEIPRVERGNLSDDQLAMDMRVFFGDSPEVGIPRETPEAPRVPDSQTNFSSPENVARFSPGNDAARLADELSAQATGRKKERGFAETVREKSKFPDEIKEAFPPDSEMYAVLQNKSTEDAANYIFENYHDQARELFEIYLARKDATAVPLGYQLSREMIQNGQRDDAIELVRRMAESMTQGGQFTQAAATAMLHNDPISSMRYLQRDIDRMNTEGKKKFRNWKDFELTDDEIRRFGEIETGDKEAIENLMSEIGDRISREYPATMWEKLVEASHVAMLLNPRTQIRNVVSNLAAEPFRWLSDRVSALGQNAYRLVNPDYQPTQALWVNRDSKKLAREIFDQQKDAILESGTPKYDNAVLRGRKDKEVFKPSILNAVLPDNLKMDQSLMEQLRGLTYDLLEKGDNLFVKNNFVGRLASEIQAGGYKSIDEVPAEAITRATKEAMRMTFKDDNNITKAVSGIKKSLGPVGEIIMPFTKTPANITARAIDYSPVGIATAFRRYVKNGKDLSDLMDSLGKAVTGTAAITAGYLLREAGVITGNSSDNTDARRFQEMQGFKPFSFRVGDQYFTYDWAQPAATPLLLGAVIYDSLSGEEAENEDNGMFSTVFNIGKRGAEAFGDALLEQSVLQDLKGIMGGYGSTTENIFKEVAETPQRLIPSTFGAIARTLDPYQRQTYDKNDFTAYQRNTAQSKIPGNRNDLPIKYDTWGRPMEAGSLTDRILQNFVIPSNVGTSTETPLDEELMRLYEETGSAAVFPNQAAWDITQGGNTTELNAEQYSEYQRIMGETSYDIVERLMKDPRYEELPDENKAKVIEDAHAFAKVAANKEMVPDYVVPAQWEDEYELWNRGINPYAVLMDAEENTVEKERKKSITPSKGPQWVPYGG